MDFEIKIPSLNDLNPLKGVVGGTESGISKALNAIKKKIPTGTINNLMKYPLEDQDDYLGRIVFTAYKTQGVDGEFLFSQSKQIAKSVDKNTQATTNSSTTSTSSTGFIKNCGQQTATKNVGTSGGAGATLTGDAVQLYLPPSLIFGSTANFSSADLGLAGTAIESALQNGSSIVGAVKEAITTEVSSLIDGLLNEAKGEAGQVAMARVARRLPDFAENGIKSATQTIVNPNTRLLFNGMGLRNFSFSFKMIPKSADEAKEIEKIIQFFREEHHPDAITLGGIKAGYHFPNKFKIDMYYGSQQVGPKINFCFLQSVNVTYNSTAMGMHEDGKFSEYEMTLMFTEERALDKKDIKAGF